MGRRTLRSIRVAALAVPLLACGCMRLGHFRADAERSRAAAFARLAARAGRRGDALAADHQGQALPRGRPSAGDGQQQATARCAPGQGYRGRRPHRAWAAIYPTAVFTGNYTRLDKVSSFSAGPQTITLGSVNNYTLALALNQPVFAGGGHPGRHPRRTYRHTAGRRASPHRRPGHPLPDPSGLLRRAAGGGAGEGERDRPGGRPPPPQRRREEAQGGHGQGVRRAARAGGDQQRGGPVDRAPERHARGHGPSCCASWAWRRTAARSWPTGWSTGRSARSSPRPWARRSRGGPRSSSPSSPSARRTRPSASLAPAGSPSSACSSTRRMRSPTRTR